LFFFFFFCFFAFSLSDIFSPPFWSCPLDIKMTRFVARSVCTDVQTGRALYLGERPLPGSIPGTKASHFQFQQVKH
jgi:hypothetical protein